MAGASLILLFISAVIILIISMRLRSKRKEKKRLEQLKSLWNSREKDLVTLHMFKRGKNCPTVSPFGLKLETFLQMTKIKYVTDFEVPMSSKGKVPWITINGEDVTDSQLCIEFLTQHFKKDLEERFSAEEKAISRAFRIMLEDHFYWCRYLESWVFMEGRDNAKLYAPGEGGLPTWLPQRLVQFFFMRHGQKTVLPQAKAQGIGRHTRKEVEELGKKALDAFSIYLGNKPFLLGNHPCLADITMFALVALFVCKPKDSESVYKRYIEEECKNLLEMYKSMINKYWPDYDKYVAGCNLP